MSSGVKPAAVTAAAQQLKNAEPVSSDAVLMKKMLPSGFTSLWCVWGNPEKPSFHVLTGETMSADVLPIVEMASVRHFNPSFPDIENRVKMMEEEGFERAGLVDVLLIGKRWYIRRHPSANRPVQSEDPQFDILVPDHLDFRG